MWTRNRNDAFAACKIAPRSLHVLTFAALAGLAPIAASSASASDTATSARVEASASAMIELVPVQPIDDVSATSNAPAMIEQAPSLPQDTVMGRGSASYYAAKFNGRRTASGERFDNQGMTAAHRTLPFGTLVRVTNVATGNSVVVRINDRGPFTAGRMIDVSRAAADELGLVARGHGTVELAVIED